ncbi:MAG: hypothetical protein JO276_09980 [Sphingomonadaceae bacterium]|nr:hypothetical protein [Sphingomonadaceae bacterium]
MRRATLFLAALTAASGLGAQPASQEESLHAFLQASHQADRENDPDGRYVAAFTDLNGDGRPEAFVYFLSNYYCGTGGCGLTIYTPAGRSWRQVADMTLVHTPVRLLPTSSHGWRDLAVTVAGGGVRAHEALLSFNGRTYPDNPTEPPARTLRRHVPGRVLIGDSDRGQPLF